MNRVEEKLRAELVKLALLPARALGFVDVDKHPAFKTPARWVALYGAYFAISARGEERFQQDVNKFVEGLLAYLDHMADHQMQLSNDKQDGYMADVKPLIARAGEEGWAGDIERVNAELDLIFARYANDLPDADEQAPGT